MWFMERVLEAVVVVEGSGAELCVAYTYWIIKSNEKKEDE